MEQERQLFCDAVRFLEERPERNVTMQELTQFLNVSKSTLFRSFRKYAGMGAHRYIMKKKIEMATQMLQQGCSVAQTAERLGFGTPAYFSTRYKQETGVNPSEVLRRP